MKRIAPLILVAVAAVAAVLLVNRKQDQAVAYTTDRDAWQAYSEGEALLQSFRYAEADVRLREAIALDPGLAMAHVALGELSFRVGVYDDGRLHYGLADSLAALVESPDAQLLLQVRLANAEISCYYDQRDSLRAVAREKFPDDLIVLLTEAMIATDEGDIDRAEDLYERILEINPNYAGAYNFLGYLYLGQGKYDDAEIAMRRYAFVAPDLANPHDSLGDVLKTVGRYEEAVEQFKTALAKQPDFYHSQLNIARIYFWRGEVDRSLALMEKVAAGFAGTSRTVAVDAEMVSLLFAHRMYDELEIHADRFLMEHGEDGKHNLMSVKIKRLLGRGETAAAMSLVDSLRADYETRKWFDVNQVETNKVKAATARYRALAAEQVGAHEEAARLFQEALTLMQTSPAHASLFERIHLAYNLIPLGAYDEARIQIRDVLSINPRISEGILVAATIEAADGQNTEALRLLDTLDRILEKADDDFPVVGDARLLREQLPDPDRI